MFVLTYNGQVTQNIFFPPTPAYLLNHECSSFYQEKILFGFFQKPHHPF